MIMAPCDNAIASTTLPICTKTRLTRQHDWLIRRFLDRLRTGDLQTSELIAVLIMLRAHNPGTPLREWCDTIAHPKRDRGSIWETGMALLHETQHIDEYLAATPLDVGTIQSAVVDAM